jgi:hypothetical protein
VTAYATQADFETYVEGWVTDNPDALARIMQRASRDIDRVCAGGEPDGTTGLKFSPTPDWFDDQQVQALKRACCAQTQYRLIRGEEFFIDYSPTRITGPDFNQEGKPPRLSPEARRELETSGDQADIGSHDTVSRPHGWTLAEDWRWYSSLGPSSWRLLTRRLRVRLTLVANTPKSRVC